MRLCPEVLRVARSIKDMRIRGAGRIARAAANALKVQAESSKARTASDFRREIQRASVVLLSTRPTAVSLPNAVYFVTLPVRSMRAASLEKLKNAVARRADEFIRNSMEAVRTIGEIGAKMVKDGETLLTHCNSECALSVIKTAHAQGKRIDVFATESRPRMQGLITVKDLASSGVPCTLIVDSAVRFFMRDIDRVVVGADVFMLNGAVVNKIGTSQIALAAREASVPFMVAAESYKFHPGTESGDEVIIEERDPSEVADPRKLPGIRIRNPAFDITPPDYIHVIITERGKLSPRDMRSFAHRLFRWKPGRAWTFKMEDSET